MLSGVGSAVLSKRCVEAFAKDIHDNLILLRSAIQSFDAHADFRRSTVGIKIRLVPRSYYWAVARGHDGLQTLCEFSSFAVKYPRMVLAAKLDGDEGGASGMRWTLGRGLPWLAMMSPAHQPVHVHPFDWEHLTQLPRREFAGIDPSVRLGRSQKDMVRLREKYGSAVGCSLRPSPSLAPFGSITAHTVTGVRMSPDEVYVCGEMLIDAAPAISKAAVKHFGYRG